MPTNFRSNGRVYLLDNFASFHARDLNQKALSLADDACAAALEVRVALVPFCRICCMPSQHSNRHILSFKISFV